MNGKKAKQLRMKAKDLACQFVKDRVLSEDLTKGRDCDSIIGTLPTRMFIKKQMQMETAIGTRRWFVQQVKKNPNVTYEQLIKEVYGETG